MDDPLGEFRQQLIQATTAAEQALQILEISNNKTGFRRSLSYQLLLVRATSILMGLRQQEQQREASEEYGALEQS